MYSISFVIIKIFHYSYSWIKCKTKIRHKLKQMKWKNFKLNFKFSSICNLQNFFRRQIAFSTILSIKLRFTAELLNWALINYSFTLLYCSKNFNRILEMNAFSKQYLMTIRLETINSKTINLNELFKLEITLKIN